MRPSEMQFSRQGGLFYTSPDEVGAPTPGSAIRDAYRTDVDHCERWQVVDEGPWRHHVCADAGPIPDQGWKIHVSAIPDDAQPTLDAVAGEIARRGIPFKHLRDEDRLRASLAKYGDRVQCGKFITVYPRDGQEAVALMTRLSRILGPREAPVVLGDARWGRSPVYFRYGAHRLVLMDDPEHGQVPALRDPTGALVPDTRAASFTCPDWVEVPGPMREHIARRGAPDTTAEDWYPYTVESVMHFSNAGGVYLASCADGDDPVVFKEARPNVGLDDDGRWAVDRLRHEAQVIEVLASVEAVVRLKETRTIGGHLFLIEEYIDGPTLSTWIAQNYPFSMSGPDTAPGGVAAQDYVRRATGICRALRRAVEQVHAAGYALIDLQPMNVLIEADDKPRLIDLEAARPLNDRSPITIGTPGFVGPEDLIAEQQDWFAYNRIVAHIFYPLVPLNAISDHLLDVQIGQARRLLSDDVAFEELLMEDPPRHHDILPMVCAGQPDDVGELRRRLVAGLEDVTEPGPHGPTVPGDIVSFSGLGRINIESGTAGVLLTEELKEGFARVNLDRLINSSTMQPRGYLSGIDGILLLRGQPLPPPVTVEHGAPVDVSLRSGLSGIVLAGLASYVAEARRGTGTPSAAGLRRMITDLERLARDPAARIVSPMSSSHKATGLVDGWSGVALALDRAALVTGEEELARAAREALLKDLAMTTTAPDGSLQVLDEGRLMPYLAEGSAGILLTALMTSPDVGREVVSEPDLVRLAQATAVRCTANGGLFMGRAGLLAARACAAVAGVDCPDVDGRVLVNELTTYCFQPYGQDGALVGGQGGLRLSADYCSGNAGMVKVIDAVAAGPDAWALLPGLESLGSLG